MTITSSFVDKLPKIYRDILAAFPRFDSTRKQGYGLSFASIYSVLSDEHSYSQIVLACQNMQERNVLEIRNEIFAHPTEIGEQLIAVITGLESPEEKVPEFPEIM